MTDRDTIRDIVRYLGRSAMIGLIVTGCLVAAVIWLSRGKGTVDAAAIALVALVAQPAGNAIAALPSLLASTRTTPDKAEIEEALAPLAQSAGAPNAGLPVTLTGQTKPLETTEVDTPPEPPPPPAP